MGQAAVLANPASVELPDPADVATGGAAAGTTDPAGAGASADDLLSKLAGEEVERLLAESDAPAPLPPAVDPPAPSAAATGAPGETATGDASPAVIPPAAAHAGTTQDPAPPPATPATGVEAAQAPAGESAVQAELDTLFTELTSKAAGSDPPQAPAASDPLSAGEVTDSPLPETTDISALEAELHKTLAAAPAVAPTSPASPPPSGTDVPATTRTVDPPDTPLDAPPSILIRALQTPLEWINAPLAGVSPALRETLGKVAIITAFNAVVVIAYVVFFRGG